MIRHLLKLVWHRKRSTALLMVEIAVSFLVVFAVAAFALHYLANWRRPIGFSWQDVWVVEVDHGLGRDEEWTAEMGSTLRQVVETASRSPRVEAAALSAVVPYEFNWEDGPVSFGSRSLMTNVARVSDGLQRTLGVPVAAGRWFGPEDDGAGRPPVVINRQLARELFGDEDPLGKVIVRGSEETRVVGVVEEYRQGGELNAAGNHLFIRVPLDGVGERRAPDRLLLRMAPGTPASQESELLSLLGAAAPAWSFEVAPLARYRSSQLRRSLAPLVIGGVVAFFLLLMVALGLLGVLWQNVTRRTRELGLRRAAGASRAAIHRQVLLELVLITSLALTPALVLVLQLPLLGLTGPLPPAVFAAAVAAALAAIYLLSLACGLYPSWIAVRSEPAEALRWE